ncbi:MAG: hypothetical protein GF329_14730 [Candidatus Lokiarchaeota archaeon]|nr:hypothetical protein [Candidatus Lokiarchaeota archaeon]
MGSKVLLTQKPILKIVASAIRFANYSIIKEEWGEIYGLLQGKIKSDLLRVTDAIPFSHTINEKSEIFLKVGFSSEDYVAAAELSEKISPEFFVGWFHSHPDIDLFLSDFDLETTLGYQSQNPDAIALVVDPFLLLKENLRDYDDNSLSEKTFGFKIFRLKNINLGVESDFYEVDWEFQGDILKTRKRIDDLFDQIPKYLPPKNIENRFQKYINLQKKKIERKFHSLNDYIKQIKNPEKCKEVFEDQFPDIKDYYNSLIKTIKKRITVLEYSEYKERNIKREFTEKFENLIKIVEKFNEKLKRLENDI